MKNIFKSVIFLTILAVMLVLCSKIFEPKNNTKQAGYEEKKIKASGIFAEPENTIDVYVVGDSESYSSYVPLEAWNKYGIASYVSGTPAQPLALTCSYVYNTFKTQKPKLVILEANTIYRRKGLEEPLRQYTHYILPIFQYHDRWKTITSNDISGETQYTSIQANKGYNYSNKIKAVKKKEYMEETEKVKNIPKSNILYVKAIKDFCESKGAQFIMYSAPSAKNWNFNKHNGVEKLAKDLNIKYIDLNILQDQVQIDWDLDSRDNGDHLNYTGAVKVTDYLGSYIKENFDIPDHRQEESYKSWDKLYQNFMENYKK